MGQGFAPQLNIPQVDFGAFGPTTFEQGLSTSAFQPLIEQAQRQALQIGSLSGIPSAAPAHFGRAIAPAIQNIGQFLASQQQQRGLTEQQRLMQEVLSSEQARQFQLSAAIGQDPFADIFAGAQLGGRQSQLFGQEQQARFQAEEAGKGGGAALLALLGGAIPGQIGTFFGGGPSPIGIQDAIMAFQLSQGIPPISGGGGGFGAGAGQQMPIGQTVPVGGR